MSRYTHRTALGNERLVGISGDQVLLRVRADGTGGKRTVAMPGKQFVGRLLQHVLPPGFKRVRHRGVLTPATETKRLALARQLLAMPATNPQAREDAQAFMRRVAAIQIACCPHCKAQHWLIVKHRSADRAANANTSAGHLSRSAGTRTRDPTPYSRSACKRRPGCPCVGHAAPARRDALRCCRTGHPPPRLPMCARGATAQSGAASIGIADTDL